MPAEGPGELGLGQHLEHELEHGLARIERLHVDVDAGAELVRAAKQRAQARGGVARPSSGASGRRSGVSAEILTETLARGIAPRCRLEHVARGQPRWAPASSVKRVPGSARRTGRPRAA